jgi:hypothetical protein
VPSDDRPTLQTGVGRGGQLQRGNVYVIDLYGADKNGSIARNFVVALDPAAYPRNALGKGPQYITSGEGRAQFLVSNAKDTNGGSAGLSFATNASDGTLTGAVAVTDPRLVPNRMGWLEAKYQQNIQRSAGSVVLTYEGKTYALVADYNFFFADAHATADDQGLGRQIGGKIGVIEDPFGLKGDPIYLGATTPIVGVALEHLMLDQSGMLYANGFVEDTSGKYSGGPPSRAS